MSDGISGCNSRFRVLIVDDDRSFAGDLATHLGGLYDVGVAYSAAEAMAQVTALKPDVVLLDIDLRDGVNGFAVLAKIRTMDPGPEVIMLTGTEKTSAVVDAIKAGAFHYVTKPPGLRDLANLVNLAAARVVNARRVAALESQVLRLAGGFVAHDASMRRVIKDIDRVGPTDSTVLIIGESGTGKELVAQRVHQRSARADRPFIAINCGAISETLIESELFGHVKGGFTDAHADRAGCFARAEGGTLFLDEIGKAPLSLQTKLLRVLEAREYLRVGSSEPVRANVRLIAASSRDLDQSSAGGEFMPELFYRVNVFSIMLPPLRARREDILPLAEHYLELYSAQMGKVGLVLSPAAREYLVNHEWRGNVRDLRNRIERAVIIADGVSLTPAHLMPVPFDIPSGLLPLDTATQEFQRAHVARALRECGGNVTEAARRLGLTREGLSRIIGKLGLREERE